MICEEFFWCKRCRGSARNDFEYFESVSALAWNDVTNVDPSLAASLTLVRIS